jgi:hypothetical protein
MMAITTDVEIEPTVELLKTLGIKPSYGNGLSKGACQRRSRRDSGKLYTGTPGRIIKMSDRSYSVAADGSFRRL